MVQRCSLPRSYPYDTRMTQIDQLNALIQFLDSRPCSVTYQIAETNVETWLRSATSISFPAVGWIKIPFSVLARPNMRACRTRGDAAMIRSIGPGLVYSRGKKEPY